MEKEKKRLRQQKKVNWHPEPKSEQRRSRERGVGKSKSLLIGGQIQRASGGELGKNYVGKKCWKGIKKERGHSGGEGHGLIEL